MTDPSGAPARLGRRRLVIAVMVGLLAVAGVVVLVVRGAGGPEYDDSGEVSAEVDRAEIIDALTDTADVLGLTMSVEPDRNAPLPCDRVDGREGVSYLLGHMTYEGDVDVDATLDAITDYWVDLGWDVSRGQIGDVDAAVATTQRGGYVRAGASAHLLNFGGETSCALEAGTPPPDVDPGE